MRLPAVRIGNAILIHGDSEKLLRSGFLRAPASEIAIVMDPPYEFDASGGGQFRAARKCMNEIVSAGLDKGFDPFMISPDIADHVVVFCHNDQVPDLSTLIKARYDRFAILTWHKKNPVPMANKHYLPDSEIYIHGWMRPSHPVGDAQDRRRVRDDPRPSKRVHPTQKPLSLMDKIIRVLPSRIIVDPYMGSGSTGLAALENGRTFIGIEKDETYFAAAVARFEKYHQKAA